MDIRDTRISSYIIRAVSLFSRGFLEDIQSVLVKVTLIASMDTPSSGTASVDVEQGANEIRKRLTLTFRDVTVRVTAPEAALGETLLSVADPRQYLGFLGKGSRPKRVCILI